MGASSNCLWKSQPCGRHSVQDSVAAVLLVTLQRSLLFSFWRWGIRLTLRAVRDAVTLRIGVDITEKKNKNKKQKWLLLLGQELRYHSVCVHVCKQQSFLICLSFTDYTNHCVRCWVYANEAPILCVHEKSGRASRKGRSYLEDVAYSPPQHHQMNCILVVAGSWCERPSQCPPSGLKPLSPWVSAGTDNTRVSFLRPGTS